MKIIIIGSGGAGKSTLARQLGEKLDIEVIHLDAHFWKENWQATSREEWNGWQKEVMQKSSWIMDGNYSSTMDTRIQAADLIIFLDFSRWLCLWGVLKRRWMYHGKTRPDMAEGCPERLDWEFLKWVYDYPSKKAPVVREKLKELKGEKHIYHLHNRKDVSTFLLHIKNDLSL